MAGGGWKRSAVGNEWRKTVLSKDGRLVSEATIQKYGSRYTFNTASYRTGSPARNSGAAYTLTDAKREVALDIG